MKKLILISFGLIMLLCYSIYNDYTCQYYGIPSFIFNQTSELFLKPKFIDYYPLRFVFLDKEGYEFIGKGFKYEYIEFEIDSIVSYGQIKESDIVVNYFDKNDSLHTLVVSDIYGEITIKNDSKFKKDGEKYDVSVDNILKIRSKKYIAIIVLCIFFTLFFKQLKLHLFLF